MKTPYGICGSAGHGKDTVAGMLIAAHQIYDKYEYKTIAFADPIRWALAGLLGEDPKTFSPDQITKKNPDSRLGGLSMRKWMQLFGTEFMRTNFGTDYWVDHLHRRTGYDLSGHIVTDVRFHNEIEMIVGNHDGYLIGVVNPNEPSRRDHSSETLNIKKYAHHVFINDGSLDDLRIAVFRFVSNR